MNPNAPENPSSEAPLLTESQRFWFDHLQKQSSSGLSMAAYAREQGLSVPAFYYWHRQWRLRQDDSIAGQPLSFQPVTLTASRSSLEFITPGLVVRLPNRIECEWRGMDARACLVLLQALASVRL